MEWWQNCFLILPFIYLNNYYYDCYDNYFSSSICCAHVLTIKLVSFNYLHVICEQEKEFPLDYSEVRTLAVLGTVGSGPNISRGLLFEVFINHIILQFVFRQNPDACVATDESSVSFLYINELYRKKVCFLIFSNTLFYKFRWKAHNWKQFFLENC